MTSEQTTSGTAGPDEHRMQGHWLLASLGKRVLRPGGAALTRALITQAAPSADDRIVEFGPGLGHTAAQLLAANPVSYIGVDPNPEGRGALEKVLAGRTNARIQVADAAETGCPDACADLVVGEAMLTMCSPEAKAAIVAEAARLLTPGGRYAIHELSLTKDADVDPSRGAGASKDISRRIKVGARPLTVRGWSELLESQGFEVLWTREAPMRLLEPSRLIADEGLLGAARFGVNLARRPEARARVMQMRASFREHSDVLRAVAILARRR
ncbi:class I SAM-dependent methyltransferase [Gephyromycinifex aptenodytis]|uniref:class I SAM-dependent methyltransferase n=1 Tax=Gephyromycinifex aptenodytis TaxID=2716227 RepID=UPI00144701B4|nr:class I SAM-dependent methyltransferase [Gephyromycinifex aptenodytis]